MFAGILEVIGSGVGTWHHDRQFASLDQQPVIRQNRDTFYSVSIADISAGAVLTLPDAGDRYLSAMVINEDHYINEVFHDAGRYELTTARFDTPYVCIGVRILVDPNDPEDVKTVHALQDQLRLESTSAQPLPTPEYDEPSFTATRTALLELSEGLGGYDHAFGSKETVDPVRHLIGTAAAWGGLPQAEAYYVNVNPKLPVGEYQLTVRDVPVDAFWSISLYNAAGYFEPNDRDAYSVNSVTGVRNDDGSTTVSFGGCDSGRPNCLPIMDGWNYLVRLYQPHPEVLSGEWTFPTVGT